MLFYKLKISLVFLLLMSCPSVVIAQQLTGDTWKEVETKKKGVITVVYLKRDAFAYIDKNGERVGLELEMFKHFLNYLKVTKRINLEVNWVELLKFPNLYKQVKNASGGVFGFGTISILEKRKTELKFSPPYLTSIAVLLTHSSAPDLQRLDQIADVFKNMKGLALQGTTHEGYVREVRKKYYPDMKIEFAPTSTEVLKQLAVENNKYFSYLDLISYWPALKQNKPIKRHPVGDKATERFGMAMPLNSDWDEIVKEFFESRGGFRSTLTYHLMLKKYFGERVGKMLELVQKK